MKKTKQEKAAEIAAMYATVANGGKMQVLIGGPKSKWIQSSGPDLASDLALHRAIPARKKP